MGLSPSNLTILLQTAILEIKNEDFKLAEKKLQKIIKLNPYFEQAYFYLGSIYMHAKKDYKKASEYFIKARKLDPDYKLAISNLNYLTQITKND